MKNIQSKFDDNKEEKIVIYCDGACSGNGTTENLGGWGAILLYKKHKKEIYGGEINTTNNIMELTACIKALEAIKIDGISIQIYTDSAYLINCFNEKWYEKWMKNNWLNTDKKPVKNKELWIKLLDLNKKYNPEFIKVAGHSGIELNERADYLARLGIKEIKNQV